LPHRPHLDLGEAGGLLQADQLATIAFQPVVARKIDARVDDDAQPAGVGQERLMVDPAAVLPILGQVRRIVRHPHSFAIAHVSPSSPPCVSHINRSLRC
jgi:hypothetical protein